MINTLATLLVALTLGTIALVLMETEPIRSDVTSLVALASPERDGLNVIRTMDVPLQPLKWRNIIIHAAPSGAADDCHFVIERDPVTHAVRMRATRLWKMQEHGDVVTGPNEGFNYNSIAVCLVGDFSSIAPPTGQFDDLVRLVRSLQHGLRISRGHVYLYRDLNAHCLSPGRAFPEKRFFNLLAPPRR